MARVVPLKRICYKDRVRFCNTSSCQLRKSCIRWRDPQYSAALIEDFGRINVRTYRTSIWEASMKKQQCRTPRAGRVGLPRKREPGLPRPRPYMLESLTGQNPFCQVRTQKNATLPSIVV